MKIKLRYILVYLFVVTLVVMGISFSRFSTTLTNSGAENTTTPDIEFSTWILKHEAASVSLENMVPGESRTIDIWVKNWEEGDPVKISDYNQSFNFELETTGNLPLEYTLREKNGGAVSLSSSHTNFYLSDTRLFSANNQETKEFILTVTWPSEIKDYQYMNEIDYIELRLKAVQSEAN